MGRTACTEPQCLYKGDLYLFLHILYVYICANINVLLKFLLYLSAAVFGIFFNIFDKGPKGPKRLRDKLLKFGSFLQLCFSLV